MKQKFISLCLAMFLSAAFMPAFATLPIPFDDTGGKVVIKMASLNVRANANAASTCSSLKLEGTGTSETFIVDASGLINDISVNATAGFSVTPSLIRAGSGKTEVTVTNKTTLITSNGKVILRSGDIRCYVYLIGKGTPLEQKDLSSSPIYSGGDESKSFDGFSPDASKGYTLEFKVKTDSANKVFYPYAISSQGAGFKGYVGSSDMGLYNSGTQKGLSNPYNGGTFYNTDGQYHTYRYAVTPDKRVFVYRDGMSIDTLRTSDFGYADGFTNENGDVSENLIKNGDFEGEWNKRSVDGLTYRIEGWDVSPLDQYNSTQEISSEERSNEVDQNNHVLEVHRYMWSAGWGAAEISQVVDVAPNEVYSFSCLAKGGIKSDNTQLGSIRITDLQSSTNKQTIAITSDSYQKYACDFTTSATCKQIRVEFYLERDKWGASISALKADDVKLIGVSRVVKPQVGFSREFANLAYFTYDTSGAYAPLTASLSTSEDTLTIDGTGKTATFSVNGENLTGSISLSATSGYTVSPKTIPANAKNATVTVTNNTCLASNTGKVILRSGDKRSYVKIYSKGSSLEQKDLSSSPIYSGGDESKSFDGFAPDASKGYTLEFKVKTDSANNVFYPYAISSQGAGFKGYVGSSDMGLYNSGTQKGLSNPYNGGTFYNTDGQYHTYRYAVTPDKRVFVYRDGMSIDTLRTSDFGYADGFTNENGDVSENLIKNGDFEGEWNKRSVDGLTYRIEGWDVSPLDQYNSTQEISSEERRNEVDQNNHVLEMHRYKWSAGWGAAEISQVVDVAPNEVYSFSCLAKGGIKSDNTQLGSIRITDLQSSTNKQTIAITSDSYQKYACDFTTSATCKQIRVEFYLERDTWGASISALKADDVKLIGVSRVVKPQVGFSREFANLAYFTYDTSGAYAPLTASLSTSEDTLTIDGTGKTATFSVNGENLTGSISLSATSGYTVSPKTIPANAKNATVTVTNNTCLASNTGKVILRSGDKRSYVKIYSKGSSLERKDLSSSPIYSGGDESKSFYGFSPDAC